MADAQASGACGLRPVEVRLLSSAIEPLKPHKKVFTMSEPKSISFIIMSVFIIIGPANNARSTQLSESVQAVQIADSVLDDHNKPLAEAIADRFVNALRKRNYSFLKEDKFESLRKEIHDFAAKYLPARTSPAKRKMLLSAIDRYVRDYFLNRPDFREEQEMAYLKFPDQVKTFQWKLWLTLNRTPITPEQFERREAQHNWIREYIKTVPIRPGDARPIGVSPHGVRKWASAYLEQELADPLSLLYDPMTHSQFEVFKQWMKRSAANGLSHTVANIPVRASGARAHNHADVEKAYSYPFDIQLPFEDEVMSIWGGGGGAGTHLSFASNALFRGRRVFLEGRRDSRYLFDIVRGPLRVAPQVQDGDPDELVARWIQKQGKGDLAYNDSTVTLTALRGGQITELDEVNWFEADALSNDELRKLIAEKGQMTISVDRLPPGNGPGIMKGDKPRFFIAVQTREMRLAVIDLKTREFGQIEFYSRTCPTDSPATTPNTQPPPRQGETGPGMVQIRPALLTVSSLFIPPNHQITQLFNANRLNRPIINLVVKI